MIYLSNFSSYIRVRLVKKVVLFWRLYGSQKICSIRAETTLRPKVDPTLTTCKVSVTQVKRNVILP